MLRIDSVALRANGFAGSVALKIDVMCDIIISKNKNLTKENNQMKKLLSFLLPVLLAFTLFTGCNNKNTTESSTALIEAVYPVDCLVSLHTEMQSKYLLKNADRLPFGINGKKEESYPEAVELSWMYGEDEVAEFVVSISKNEDMTNSKTYTTAERKLSLYNLELATDYYWTVSVNGETSEISKFTTSGDAPRFICVDGITNVRDIGGWLTEDGTRTKQGLIYRCGRLNESADNGCSVIITEAGKKTMVEDLGVKTELDLRQLHTGETGGITSSPLGEEVKYISCPMDWSGDLHGDNKKQILEFFKILSDEANYPIIVHCSIGTDRTGMLSFLLNALLGVSEEDLYRDYMFSNFAEIGSKRKLTQLTESKYYNDVKNAPGDTLSEKAYSFLAEIGVHESQLDSIISILTK